jgi:hypothetical protein
VLLHLRDPIRVYENCARLADTIVVTDLCYPELPDDRPAMHWFSGTEMPSLDTWWKFSPQFFVRVAEVMGFTRNVVTRHEQMWAVDGPLRPAPMYTVVSSARRTPRARGA